jgi:hypothetical protein
MAIGILPPSTDDSVASPDQSTRRSEICVNPPLEAGSDRSLPAPAMASIADTGRIRFGAGFRLKSK